MYHLTFDSTSNRSAHPDFLLIGAPKSGTTWVVKTLQSLDGVYIPIEEIHYFSRFYCQKNWQWYLSHFRTSRSHHIVGENSNTYLTDENAASRIYSDLPNVKLVAVLRNPIERAYSGYCMQLARGKVDEDIEAHLDPLLARSSSTLTYGKYYRQLERFFDRFRQEQIFVVIYDDLFQKTQELLVELVRFLEVPQPEHVRPFPGRVNAKKTAGIPLLIRRIVWPIVRREAVRKPLVKLLRGMPLGRKAESMLSRPVRYPPLPDHIWHRLAEYYGEDVSQLSHLLGRNLSSWLDAPIPVGKEAVPRVRA